MKTKLKTYTVALVLTTLLAACSNDFAMDEYQPKIAVDGRIENGKTPIVYISYSSNFIGEYDSLDFINMIKLNISAFVITEDRDTIGMTRRTDASQFPPFYYTTSPTELIGTPGEQYQLLIRKSGYPEVTASTTIPLSKPDYCNATFTYFDSTSNYGFYKTEIGIASDSYYFLTNKRNNNPYFPIAYPARSSRMSSLNYDTIKIDMTRAQATNLWSTNEEPDTSSIPSIYFADTDTVMLKVSSIDYESFCALSSLFIDEQHVSNPFRPLSELPTSNITNGLGHWTGMNVSYFKLSENKDLQNQKKSASY